MPIFSMLISLDVSLNLFKIYEIRKGKRNKILKFSCDGAVPLCWRLAVAQGMGVEKLALHFGHVGIYSQMFERGGVGGVTVKLSVNP